MKDLSKEPKGLPSFADGPWCQIEAKIQQSSILLWTVFFASSMLSVNERVEVDESNS